MERTVVIEIFLLSVFGTFQTFKSLSVLHDVAEISRIEESNVNFSQPTEGGVEEKEATTVFEDIYGTTITNTPDDGRRKTPQMGFFNDSATTEISETTSDPYAIYSDVFKACALARLEPEEYLKLANGSVFVPTFEKVFPPSDYIIDNDGMLHYCPDFFPPPPNGTETPNFPDHIGVISVVGSSISVACLIVHIVAYIISDVFMQAARNLPSCCLLSLCIALLLAYIFSFIIGHMSQYGEACRVGGMLMFYFFLAAFFWMNVYSYDVWRSIRLATTKLRLTADRPMMVRFARYSLYAWGSPLLIAILSIIIHNSTSNIHYQLMFDSESCWFKDRVALALYFAGPLFTLIGINILFTVSSFCMIPSASVKSSSGKVNFDLRARFCLSLKLGSSMGLTWLFGVIANVTEQEWLWYLFAICSALQGVFIFFSFTMSERNRKEFRKLLRSRKLSSTRTQCSSNRATSV